MPLDLRNLRIHRLIVHEIAERTDTNKPGSVNFGGGLITLEPEARDTLTKRMTDALGSLSHCVEMDIDAAAVNGAGTLVAQLLSAKDDAFQKLSKDLPRKLSVAQVRRNIPGGIVVVVTGATGNPTKEFCSIIKAEVHAGFHKRSTNNQVSAEFLSDLFLTPQQKLYKIGIFVLNATGFEIFVYDHNMTRAETSQAAQYFYHDFLGCRIAKSSAAQTQNFFLYAREFINDLDVDLSKKMDYQDAMYAYLRNKNNNVVSVGEFSKEFIEPDHQDQFVAHMRDAGFPGTAVVKDTRLLKGKLRRRILRFSTGVSLTRRDGLLRDVVKIAKSDDKQTTVIIKGRLLDQST